jgi:hypothetical protein
MGFGHCHVRRHDAELLAGGVDDTNFAGTDASVDA